MSDRYRASTQPTTTKKNKHKEKKSYMHCLSHSVILGLLRGEAFVGSVASLSQPCLLLKALNALLSLLWNGQEHMFTQKSHHKQF